MCTVSWLHTDGGYHLLCNRDELRSRKPALAPRLQEMRGVQLIAPADGNHGGSWIGVNQFGLSLCLLNRYGDEARDETKTYTSRGLLLMELLDSPSQSIARDRINEWDLSQFQPFTLAALEPGADTLVIHWTGREREVEADGESQMPLISSSFDTEGVMEFRRQHFKQMAEQAGRVDADLLYAFQTSHAPARGPYSPCMHREDAHTVSFSWIKVLPHKIEFLYYPQAPCSVAMGDPIELQRAQTVV